MNVPEPRSPSSWPGDHAPSNEPAPERDGEPSRSVLLLSGPNLTLLGLRQPEIYGTEILADHVARAEAAAASHGLSFRHLQSDHEADLAQAVHLARGTVGAIVVNAGALTHYGWALHDALACFDGVVVELHLSSPLAREPWRHISVIAPVADGSISGLGGLGYELAIEAVARLLDGREPSRQSMPLPGAVHAGDSGPPT